MKSALTIASVCRTLPTPDEPTSGIFVMRRLSAVARRTDLRILQPIPYFPFIRPRPKRTAAHEVAGFQIEHVPMFYVPKFFKGLDSYWLYRAVRDRLARIKSAGELDLVDAHFAYPDGVGCLRAAKEIGVPVFITLRGVEEDYLQVPVIARQIKAALRSVDGCICVSHSLRETALAAGADPKRVRVIHNAVDPSIFRPRDRKDGRSKVGIDEDTRLIVAVGNLLSVKRHDVLIKAVAGLGPGAADVRLAIIGGEMHEPGYSGKLHRLCETLGVAERVTFTGRLSPARIADWLTAANVFALASRREGCCNAVLEALACGLPVVATDVGDNPWFVKDGENGFIVPVDDSAAMGQALSAALDRSDWDRNHIAKTLSVGDWNSVAKEVLEFFEEWTTGR